MAERKQSDITISIETATMIKGVALIVLTIFIINIAGSLAHPLILLAVSFFLAIALNPSVNWLTKRFKNRSRIRATAMSYVVLLALLISFFSLILPPLISQTVDFVQDVPQTIRDAQNQDTSIGQFVQKYNLEKSLDNFASDFGSRYGDLSKPAIATATTIGTTIVSVITVLVLTFMMLIEGPKWLDRFWAIQPATKRELRKEMGQKMYRVVTGFVNGQMLIAFIAGVFTFVTLAIASQIFDVTINAVALSGIVFLFALLPLIGATLGAVIVVIACLFVSVPLAIVMAIFFVIYQQVENITLQPLIQSKTNKLTPLIVFTAALTGASIGGLMGALFAIPVAGCIRILIEGHYKKRLEQADIN